MTAVLGLFTAALVAAQALLLAAVLAPAVQGTATLSTLGDRIALLACVLAARAITAWAQERAALRAAARTIADLREQVVAHAAALGPRWLAVRGPHVATLTTRGLSNLEPYFVRYLPQLLLAATVTPLTGVVILGLDWVSAVIALATLPLVPLFMILVGKMTQGTAERRLGVMQRLGAQVLDLLAGLPTLWAYGRQRGPEARVRALGEANRRATMGTLRVAFLSGMVLELLTTLSVAIIAVGIGLRLVEGAIDLEPALAILVLAPEIYVPIRAVGMQFHASTDGIAAANEAFAVLDEPAPPRGERTAPRLRQAAVVLDGIGVRAGDRPVYAPANLSLRLDLTGPGRVIALTGPNGVGKTTAAHVLLGLIAPDTGTVCIDDADGPVNLADLDPETYWSQVAWVPQRPPIPPGTLRDAVCGRHDLDDRALAAIARDCALEEIIADLPHGWDTVVGRDGYGLSLGQRQRVALAATLTGNPNEVPLVILDEPTAHLDAASERTVLQTVVRWRDEGRTVVIVAHRQSLVAIADEVIDVTTSARDVTASSEETA